MPYKFHIPFRIVNDIGKHKCKKSNKCSIKSSSSQALFNYALPTFSMVALLLLGILTINPVIGLHSNNDSAYAEEVKTTGTAISLTIDGEEGGDSEVEEINSSITANTGDIAYISHNVTVNATNIENYTLQLTSTNSGSTSLQHESGTISIAPTTNTTLNDNTWGYSWSNTDSDISTNPYYGLPTYGTTGTSISNGLLESANADSNGNVSFTKKLTFGAKFGNDLPAGHYATTALLSLAASPKEVTGVGFGGYTYMQEITKAKCNNITDTEGRLIDQRDNKIYWVAKLKDGLCWMTQNLDYDGGSVAGYSGSDKATLSEENMNFGTDFATTQKFYYNPGDYVYASGSKANSCSSQDLGTGLSGCTNNGWNPISPSAITDQTLEQSLAESLHYHAGNIYNLIAATNGTGNSATSDGANASGSICPTGWSLPLGGTSNESKDGSFYKLLNGLNDKDMTSTPYFFVRSGQVNQSSLRYAGSDGYYWSATAFSNTNVYALNISNNSIIMHRNSYRDLGLSVRCVAR